MVVEVQPRAVAIAFVALVVLAVVQLVAANTEIKVFGPVLCADSERFENIAPRLTRSWCVFADTADAFAIDNDANQPHAGHAYMDSAICCVR